VCGSEDITQYNAVTH